MSYLLEKFKMKGKVMEVCDRYARNVLASLATVAHTGNYNDLSNKPTIPSLDNYYNKDEVDDIVDDINQLPSSSGASIGDVLTHTISGDGWYPPVKELPVITSGDDGKVLEVDNGSPAWVEPQVFSQEQSNWTEANTTSVSYIKNKPNLATVATSGSYNDLYNTPSLSTVATSGSYNDLSNKPTKISQFTRDTIYSGDINGGTILSKAIDNNYPGITLWRSQSATDAPDSSGSSTTFTIMISKWQDDGKYTRVFAYKPSGETWYAETGGSTPTSLSWKKVQDIWHTSGDWKYKYENGAYHLCYTSTLSSAMTSSLGNLFYRSSTYSINFPFTLSNLYSVQATVVDSSGLDGITVQNFSNTNISFWLWTGNSGTRTIRVFIDIIAI